MRDDVTLINLCQVNGWQIKQRCGRVVRIMRLPKYTIWLGDSCFEEFRRLSSAKKWCKSNKVNV